jgi:hypothetical protein
MLDVNEVPEFAGLSIVNVGDGEYLFTMVDEDRTPVITRRITRKGLIGLFVYTGHTLHPDAVIDAYGR